MIACQRQPHEDKIRNSKFGIRNCSQRKKHINIIPLRSLRLLCVLCGLLWSGVAAAQDELVLVSPHWEGIKIEFTNAFKAHYKAETDREVDLKWLDVGGASDILKFIRSDFKNKPQGIGIDLFFGGGIDPFDELKKLEYLAPYRVPDSVLTVLAPHIGGVPLYDPDYTWYAATMAGFGIIYNKEILRRLNLPEPKTWEDLTDPRLFTWIGSADPRKSGSVHMAYEIILQAYGWERGWQIISALGANVRGFSSSAAQTPKDVAVGEVAYGLSIDFYAWQQVKEAGADMIGYIMPEDLTVVNGDAIAILKGAPNRSVAERFIRFVLSVEGQKLWMLRLGEPDGPRQFELGRFSVMPGLYAQVAGRTPVQFNPFEWKSEFVYDAQKGSARWGVVNDLMGSFIIDTHDRLTATWRQMIRQGPGVAVPARIMAIPISEDEALRLVEEERWRDPTFRNTTLNAWAAHARETYYADSYSASALRNIPAIIALILGVSMVVYMRRRSRT